MVYLEFYFGQARQAALLAVAAAALNPYNVDPSSVSISGISSGGFFSVQLGVAYSDVFPVGFGVFAGGPYDCARNQPVGLYFYIYHLNALMIDFLSYAVYYMHVQPNTFNYYSNRPHERMEWQPDRPGPQLAKPQDLPVGRVCGYYGGP